MALSQPLHFMDDVLKLTVFSLTLLCLADTYYSALLDQKKIPLDMDNGKWLKCD